MVVILICIGLFSTIFVMGFIEASDNVTISDSMISYIGSVLGSITTIAAIYLALLANKKSEIKDIITVEILFPLRKALSSYFIEVTTIQKIISFNLKISKLENLKKHDYYNSKHNKYKKEVDDIIHTYGRIISLPIRNHIGNILKDNFINEIEKITKDENILKYEVDDYGGKYMDYYPDFHEIMRKVYNVKFQDRVIEAIENEVLSDNPYCYRGNILADFYCEIIKHYGIPRDKYLIKHKVPVLRSDGENDTDTVEFFLEDRICSNIDFKNEIYMHEYIKKRKKEIMKLEEKIKSLLNKIANSIDKV